MPVLVNDEGITVYGPRGPSTVTFDLGVFEVAECLAGYLEVTDLSVSCLPTDRAAGYFRVTVTGPEAACRQAYELGVAWLAGYRSALGTVRVQTEEQARRFDSKCSSKPVLR